MEYSIENNIYGLNVNDVFAIGKRHNNYKRDFLFISKLIGKHLTIDPDTLKDTGEKLANLVPNLNNVSGKETLVIGLCETATGIGMAVAACIDDCTYQTSTREPIVGTREILSFEETHSHASNHRIISDTTDLTQFKRVILVDDEITTGNSILHLMEQIESISHMIDYIVVTILDWRQQDHYYHFSQFASDHSCTVNVEAMFTGKFSDDNKKLYINDNLPFVTQVVPATQLDSFPRQLFCCSPDNSTSYVTLTGRFGVKQSEISEIERYASGAAKMIASSLGVGLKSVLVLGHGENIYIPSRIASHLKSYYETVRFKSTSRTPIYCDGTVIKDAEMFMDRGVEYFFYNRKEAESFDKTVLLTETPLNLELCNNIVVFNL